MALIVVILFLLSLYISDWWANNTTIVVTYLYYKATVSHGVLYSCIFVDISKSGTSYCYDYLYPHLLNCYLLLFCYLNQEGKLRSTSNESSCSFAKARASMTLFNMFGPSSSWGIGVTKPRSVSNGPSWMSVLFQNGWAVLLSLTLEKEVTSS